MKVKVNFSRRHSFYATFLACGTALWLMVSRFGVSKERLLEIGLICAVLLVALMALAAFVAFVLRLFLGHRDKNFASRQTWESSNNEQPDGICEPSGHAAANRSVNPPEGLAVNPQLSPDTTQAGGEPESSSKKHDATVENTPYA